MKERPREGVVFDWITDALEESWWLTERALRGCDERDFDAPTSCPGWRVRDIVNHLTGTELLLNGARRPEAAPQRPAYVKNSRGEDNEVWVASRRDLSAPEVLDDLHRATTATLNRLRRLEEHEWRRETRSRGGARPLHDVQEIRVIDSWIHLHDIRDALLDPTEDHGQGEEIVLNHFEAALPYVWAARASAPEGALLRVNLAGRRGRSFQVQVRGGRGVAVASSTQVPTFELTTAVPLFWRRMAGRINAQALSEASCTDIRGDRDLAWRLVDALNVVPKARPERPQ